MKQFILILILSSLSINIMSSQDNCSRFYPFVEGTTYQITNFDKKGKTVGVFDYKVTDKRILDSSEVVTITSDVKDKNGELMISSTYDISCTNESISLDFKSLISPQIFDQYSDFDVDITGTNLVLPNQLFIGQELDDASLLMVIKMGITMNMQIDITNRKVIDQEEISIPIGSFNCYVITYSSSLKMGVTRSGTTKQWYAEGFGLVKQEEYNKKGKLISSSLLTHFNN